MSINYASKTGQTLEEALESVDVVPACDLDGTPHSIEGWYGVMTDENSIIAYFASSDDAYRYRLDLVNKRLNG